MASSAQMAVIIKSEDGIQKDATLHYTIYSAADRTKRAIVGLVGCWTIAAISLPIPVGHLVLVPGFFIAGPILAFLRLRMGESKEKVLGTCPHDNAEISVKLENTDTIPKYTYCPECKGPIQILKKDE